MNKYQRLAAVSAALIVGMSSGAYAESDNPDQGFGLESYSASTLMSYNDGDVETRTLIGTDLRITKSFLIKMAADVEELADFVNGEDIDDAALAQLEAHIDLNVAGQPVLVIAGKLIEEDWQENLAAVQLSNLNDTNSQELRGVIGVRVELTDAVLDQMSIAITEAGGEEVRVTAKAAHALNERFEAFASVSYEDGEAMMGDDDDSSNEGSFAGSIGLIVNTDDVVSGTEVFGTVTGAQAGYGSFADDTTMYEGGINWAASDVTNFTLGAQYMDEVNEWNKYIGASHEIADGISLEGKIGDSDVRGNYVEVGASFKF